MPRQLRVQRSRLVESVGAAGALAFSFFDPAELLPLAARIWGLRTTPGGSRPPTTTSGTFPAAPMAFGRRLAKGDAFDADRFRTAKGSNAGCSDRFHHSNQ
jgi:hypothetical protein